VAAFETPGSARRRLGLGGGRAWSWGLLLLLALAASGCGAPWNSPYPRAEQGKNILYSSFSERPKHLDPVRSYSANEYTFIGQIYEPPLQYHYLKRPYTLMPLTAEALPRPVYLDDAGNVLPDAAATESIDRSVYEIRIRPGILYQPHPAFAKDRDGRYRYHGIDESDLDGVHELADFRHTGSRELVAADYVYQLKRMVHPRLHSPIAGLMKEHVLGMSEYAQTLKQALAEVTEEGASVLDLRHYPHPGVEVVDRYTYRVTVKGKYPQFAYWLAMPFFAPMPWEADQFYSRPGMSERNITLDWYPVGTGPFMLVENNPNRRMVLARNPNFRGEPYPSEGEPGDAGLGLLDDAGETMPFIDKAVFSLEKETIPYWNKFLQGYYDASRISSDSFDQAIQFGNQGDPELTPALADKDISLATAVTASIYYTGFNMLDPVVGGKGESARKLRQAISIAIDYEEYVSIFTNGRGISAQGPIPPGIFGHREGEAGINPYVYDWVEGKAQRKSIEEARRLLAEAGYPNGRDVKTGKPLTLYLDTTATGPDDKARLDWMRKQFSKLDIQLVVRATDYNRFQEKMRKGTDQIFQWGWNADYPDPENFLFLLYGPNGKVKHGGENAANYDDPEFNRLFERMKNMYNGPPRQAIIDGMLKKVQRDAPWLWGFHPKSFSLHHAWYRNSKPNLMANNTLKYKRVDPALRALRRKQWNRPVLWPLYLAAGFLVLSLIPAYVGYRRRERMAAQ
jgi:oligopeptide transport system substrate-binding protein